MESQINNKIKELNLELNNKNEELKKAIELGKSIRNSFDTQKYALNFIKHLFNLLDDKNIFAFIDEITMKCVYKKILLPDIFVNILLYDKDTQLSIAYSIVLGIASKIN